MATTSRVDVSINDQRQRFEEVIFAFDRSSRPSESTRMN